MSTLNGFVSVACALSCWFAFAATGPAVAQHIFWTDTLRNEIWTSDFSGSNAHPIVTNLPASPESIAIDRFDRKVYWTLDGSVNQIRRANLDGSSVETVLDNGAGPNVIAIDVLGRKMYFGGEDDQSIHRANLDGTNLEFLANFAGEAVTSIGVDPVAGHLYWTVERAADLYRSNLDGTNAGLLIDGPAPNENFGRLESVFVDPLENQLYLIDEDDSRIYTMALPNDSPTFFKPDDLLHPRDMTIDVAGRRLYWTQAGGIFSSQLDGSGVEPVVSGLDEALSYYPVGIAIIPEPTTVILALTGLASWCAFKRK